jgi:hypothetical protein
MYGQHATNGFQPLFGFLMVPSFWIFHDPLSPVRDLERHERPGFLTRTLGGASLADEKPDGKTGR